MTTAEVETLALRVPSRFILDLVHADESVRQARQAVERWVGYQAQREGGSVELAIYKALKSLNFEEGLVDSAINAMKAYFEDRVTRATLPVVAEMRAMKGALSAKIDAFSAKVEAYGSKVDVYAQANLEKAASRCSTMTAVPGSIALFFTVSTAPMGALKLLGYLEPPHRGRLAAAAARRH